MIEVLVVIAILCVIAGVVATVSAAAQQAAIRATCIAHLRQMTLGALSWATEHEGALPPALLHGTDRNCLSGDVRAWDWHRRPDGTVQPGTLWSHVNGVNAHGVMHCPTVVAIDATWNGDPVTGYNYNVAFIAGESRTPGSGDERLGAWDLISPKANLDGDTHLTLAQCRRGSTTALFGVGGRRGGVNKFMRSPENVGPQYDLAYAGGQAFRDGSNVARVDGSVDTARQAFKGMHADALPGWIVDTLDWPANGFLSNDASAYDPR